MWKYSGSTRCFTPLPLSAIAALSLFGGGRSASQIHQLVWRPPGWERWWLAWRDLSMEEGGPVLDERHCLALYTVYGLHISQQLYLKKKKKKEGIVGPYAIAYSANRAGRPYCRTSRVTLWLKWQAVFFTFKLKIIACLKCSSISVLVSQTKHKKMVLL